MSKKVINHNLLFSAAAFVF